jgi:hypothetical protein
LGYALVVVVGIPQVREEGLGFRAVEIKRIFFVNTNPCMNLMTQVTNLMKCLTGDSHGQRCGLILFCLRLA